MLGIQVLSVILHIAIFLRILAFKWKSKQDKYFDQFKKSFENQSLSNFTTNVAGVFIFVAGTYLLLFVNNMDPSKANLYPNYLYIYGMHLYAPFLFAGYFGISYYIRHKLLRTEIKREIEDMLQDIFPKK
jgi:hypothetical protein